MSWGSWLKPRDARGRESRTLAFVGITWALMTARFVAGGFAVAVGDFRWEIAATAMVDYGAAVAAVLAVWLGREWINKRSEKNA